jgi:hypothetical protein
MVHSTLADPNPNLTLTLTLTLALTLNLTLILMNRKMLYKHSPSLFQNYVLTGVASFEVYVSDVIGRQFEIFLMANFDRVNGPIDMRV